MSEKWIGRGLAFVAVFFWGAAYVWAKTVMAWLPPFAASGARYGLAAICLLLLALGHGNPFKGLGRRWGAYLAIGGIGVAGFQASLFCALQWTSAVSASVIMALTPALTALGAAMFLGESLSILSVLGIIVSVAGATLAVLGDNPAGLAGLSLDWGEPLVLVSALCMAFYTIAGRRLMRTDVAAISNVAAVVTIGAIFLIPMAVYDVPARPPASAAPVLALFAVALGSTVVTYLSWNHAIALIGVREPNMIFNLMPVVTMLLASFEGHPPWPEQIFGAALVILGISLGMVRLKTPHAAHH